MSFHDALGLEIYLEFEQLSAGLWARVEDALWIRQQHERAAWSEHGQWWRRTTLGKRRSREAQIRRYGQLRKVVVAVAVCKGCGKPFERTAYDAARRRGRVCSIKCRGRARQNIKLVRIGGEALPLARWAERYGIALKTVCKRIKMGRTVVEAVTTPVSHRGHSARSGEVRHD